MPVGWVRGVVFIGHNPLVEGEDTSRLQHPIDVPVDTRKVVAGVTCRLDRVHVTERTIREWCVAEVTLCCSGYVVINGVEWEGGEVLECSRN